MGSSEATNRNRDAASKILDVAERLVQTRGFNGFSYADIADRLHITKAAVHHHFPTKAKLGEVLIARYASRFMAELASLDALEISDRDKLEAYARLYADVLRAKRMCLCGMLAAEYTTLPEGMRRAVRSFFDENEHWLERVLEEGRRDGSLTFEGPARDVARMIVSSLEGAMLVSRPFGDVERFESTAEELLATLSATGRTPRRGG